MKISITFCFLFLSLKCFGWGRIGHYTCGEIAHRLIKTKTKQKIKTLINNQSLAQISNWADEIRSDEGYDYIKTWHWVNIKDGKTYNSQKKNPKGDIILAIKNQIKTLKAKKSTKKQKVFALKLLVHLMGDLHQPLHIGRKKDRGGNNIKLKWFGKKTNLHSIWDTHMIELKKLSFSELSDFILQKHKIQKKWSSGGITDWAQENMEYRSKVYSYPKKRKKYWEYKYFYQHKDLIEVQLLKAGVRLAKVLDEI